MINQSENTDMINQSQALPMSSDLIQISLISVSWVLVSVYFLLFIVDYFINKQLILSLFQFPMFLAFSARGI